MPAPVIDKPVVENTAQPRTEVGNAGELVAPPINRDQHILKYILRVCRITGESEGKPVKPPQVRSDQLLEGMLRFVHGSTYRRDMQLGGGRRDRGSSRGTE